MTDYRINWLREKVSLSLSIPQDTFNELARRTDLITAVLNDSKNSGLLFYTDDRLEEVEVEGSQLIPFFGS